MLAQQVPVNFLSENDLAFAIRDINPRDPVHVLIIPREHIADAREISTTHHKINVYVAKVSHWQPRTVLEAREGSLEASESEKFYRNWKMNA